MQLQPKSSEEQATEIWALIHSGLVKDGVRFPKNFDGIGAAYGGYARLVEALAQKDAEVDNAIKHMAWCPQCGDALEQTGTKNDYSCFGCGDVHYSLVATPKE